MKYAGFLHNNAGMQRFQDIVDQGAFPALSCRASLYRQSFLRQRITDLPGKGMEEFFQECGKVWRVEKYMRLDSRRKLDSNLLNTLLPWNQHRLRYRSFLETLSDDMKIDLSDIERDVCFGQVDCQLHFHQLFSCCYLVWIFRVHAFDLFSSNETGTSLVLEATRCHLFTSPGHCR